MKQTAIFPKVANDMFWVQLFWALGFLGVMLVINIIKIIIATFQGNEPNSYYDSIFIAANIFMLVIGILAIYFLPHYVGNGVTRKDYYKGTLLASVGLSITIPIITICISLLEQMILKNIDKVSFKAANIINEVVLEIDSNIVGDIVQSIILTPYVDPQSNWFLAICVFSLNIFMYYLAGWLISTSFYRFGAGTGLGFIIIALIVLMLEDVLLRISLDLPIPSRFSTLGSLPLSITILSILFIIFISIWIIRLLTKRVTIKI